MYFFYYFAIVELLSLRRCGRKYLYGIECDRCGFGRCSAIRLLFAFRFKYLVSRKSAYVQWSLCSSQHEYFIDHCKLYLLSVVLNEIITIMKCFIFVVAGKPFTHGINGQITDRNKYTFVFSGAYANLYFSSELLFIF